ncbi:hypothetical protein RO787_04795 [Blautia coccoides]|nr:MULTISPECIES: hypothetical protein [Blautia]MDT4372665.1 hypothetical protein [Blautia coccoides]
MCVTICGRFGSDEGGVARATLTELESNLPQSGACRLSE